MKINKTVKQVWEAYFLSVFFPTRCPVCDQPVAPFGQLICESCRQQIQFVRDPYCMKCGKALKHATKEFCYDCSIRSHEYLCGRAVFEYRCMRQSVYRYKYMGRREYSKYYGLEMTRVLGRQIRKWKPDALVPVPLHKARQRKRGYNQAELLAKELGKYLEIPVCPDLITRIRNTAPQKTVAGDQRQNNLKKAFKMGRDDVKLKTIVIIDDIYTTGSTIDAIAGELKRHGIRNIYFAVLAIGSSIEQSAEELRVIW